jgi:hypothetical protein
MTLKTRLKKLAGAAAVCRCQRIGKPVLWQNKIRKVDGVRTIPVIFPAPSRHARFKKAPTLHMAAPEPA